MPPESFIIIASCPRKNKVLRVEAPARLIRRPVPPEDNRSGSFVPVAFAINFHSRSLRSLPPSFPPSLPCSATAAAIPSRRFHEGRREERVAAGREFIMTVHSSSVLAEAGREGVREGGNRALRGTRRDVHSASLAFLPKGKSRARRAN